MQRTRPELAVNRRKHMGFLHGGKFHVLGPSISPHTTATRNLMPQRQNPGQILSLSSIGCRKAATKPCPFRTVCWISVLLPPRSPGFLAGYQCKLHHRWHLTSRWDRTTAKQIIMLFFSQAGWSGPRGLRPARFLCLSSGLGCRGFTPYLFLFLTAGHRGHWPAQPHLVFMEWLALGCLLTAALNYQVGSMFSSSKPPPFTLGTPRIPASSPGPFGYQRLRPVPWGLLVKHCGLPPMELPYLLGKWKKRRSNFPRSTRVGGSTELAERSGSDIVANIVATEVVA